MAFQVKEVTSIDQKSVQEVEENLLNKHKEEQEQENFEEQQIPKEDIAESVEELKSPEYLQTTPELFKAAFTWYKHKTLTINFILIPTVMNL